MYHLTDHTHGWNMGGVRIVYIGWAADGVWILLTITCGIRDIQQG